VSYTRRELLSLREYWVHARVRIAHLFFVFCFVFFVRVLCLVPNATCVSRLPFLDCPFSFLSYLLKIITFSKNCRSNYTFYVKWYKRYHMKMTCIIVDESKTASKTESRTESKNHTFLVILLSVTYSSSALTQFIRYIYVWYLQFLW